MLCDSQSHSVCDKIASHRCHLDVADVPKHCDPSSLLRCSVVVEAGIEIEVESRESTQERMSQQTDMLYCQETRTSTSLAATNLLPYSFELQILGSSSQVCNYHSDHNTPHNAHLLLAMPETCILHTPASLYVRQDEFGNTIGECEEKWNIGWVFHVLPA